MDADRMEAAQPLQGGSAGDLSWRLSSHPITLLTFLAFRICASTVRLLSQGHLAMAIDIGKFD